MKKFEAIFIKKAVVLGPGNTVIQTIKQTFFTDQQKVNVPIPDGFQLMSLTEYLPDINLDENDKETNHKKI